MLFLILAVVCACNDCWGLFWLFFILWIIT